MGRYHETNSQVADAREYYEKAIAIQPKHVNAHIHLGGLYLSQGLLNEAHACLMSAVHLDCNHHLAWYALCLSDMCNCLLGTRLAWHVKD